MDVITFFSSIDGIPYYLMLVVNVILIFAILGYLGDKNNEKYEMLGSKSDLPNTNGTVNLNTVTTPRQSESSIPVVGPTVVNNNQLENNINNNYIQQNSNTSIVNNNQFNENKVFVNDINNNYNPQITNLENNSTESNNNVPAVLVINGDSTNTTNK